MSTYIIAEIGINHNNQLHTCLEMIDAASAAGCDAIKLQVFEAKNFYPRLAGKADWKDNEKKYSYDIYKAVESYELPLEWLPKIIGYCKEKTIDFLSSVFDKKGFDCLVKQGMKSVKLSSYTVTHLPLLRHIAKHKIPIFMSTGGASLGEVEKAVNSILSFHSNLTLLHCSIDYPTHLADCNLGVIETLKKSFGLNVGYSDHTQEISKAPIQAIRLGASVLEKHITLSRKMSGPDHFFALEPDQLKEMVRDIRKAENNISEITIDPIIVGLSQRKCYPHEKKLRDFAYMSIFSKYLIQKDQIISVEDLIILRPGNLKKGLSPEYLDLFSQYEIKATQIIQPEESITWGKIFKKK